MASNTTSTDLDEDDDGSCTSGPSSRQGSTHQPSSSEAPVAATSSRLHAVPPVQGAEKRKFRRVKKPQEMPSRPLSAYNLFFKEARIEWLAEADQVAALEQDEDAAAARDPPKNPDGTRKRRKSRLFEKMAKEIGRRWKDLTPTRKRKYEELAEVDKQRYRREMNEYQEKLIIGKEQEGSKNAKSKKLKKASFQQGQARQEENSDDEKKPRARPVVSSGTTNVSESEMLSLRPEFSSLPSASRYTDETGSAPSSQEGSMDSTSNLGSSVQQALAAVLDHQRREEELRLMAAALARHPPPNPPVNWQELLSVSNLLHGNHARQASQVLTEGTPAPAPAAPSFDYHGNLQEQQRLIALALSNAQGNQHVSQEHRSPTVDPSRASYSRSDQNQPEDVSRMIEMLLQQELLRRSQIFSQIPSTMQLEQPMRQDQFEALLRSQRGHQAQGYNSTTFTQTRREQELQRLSSSAQEPFSGSTGPNVASLGASIGQGQGQQLQNYDPTNPYEVMALLSYLSQQEQQNRSSQGSGQHGTKRDQQE